MNAKDREIFCRLLMAAGRAPTEAVFSYSSPFDQREPFYPIKENMVPRLRKAFRGHPAAMISSKISLCSAVQSCGSSNASLGVPRH